MAEIESARESVLSSSLPTSLDASSRFRAREHDARAFLDGSCTFRLVDAASGRLSHREARWRRASRLSGVVAIVDSPRAQLPAVNVCSGHWIVPNRLPVDVIGPGNRPAVVCPQYRPVVAPRI